MSTVWSNLVLLCNREREWKSIRTSVFSTALKLPAKAADSQIDLGGGGDLCQFNFCVSSGLWVTHLLDRYFHHIHLNTETQNNCSVFVWRGLSVLTLGRPWVLFCSYIASRHLTHYPAPAYEMFSSEPHRTVFSNLFCCTGLLFVKIPNVRTPRALLPLHSTVCIS